MELRRQAAIANTMLSDAPCELYRAYQKLMNDMCMEAYLKLFRE